MNKTVRLNARPTLRSPNMLAAWPGVGNVAMIIANYIHKKLPFKKLAELDAAYFFDPIGVVVKDNIVEAPQFPRNNFYYYKGESEGSDLILFLGDAQPQTNTYELANAVLNLGARFKAKRVYTCAAALTRIHHTEPSGVWGVATTAEVADCLPQYGLESRNGNLQIAGLNGLLLGAAKEQDMEGVCLLGEVPLYSTRIQNPMAALSVLKVLTKMLNIEVDMAELTQVAGETTERLKQAAAEAMGEYIDYFTEPIWEQDEDEEEDEEE